MLEFLKQLFLSILKALPEPPAPPTPSTSPVQPLEPSPQPPIPKPLNDPLESLLNGLIYAESRGDVYCIGDKNIPESLGGPAYGILQIRSGVRGQLNSLWKTNYKGTDLLGIAGAEISKNMCRDYFTRIVPTYINYKLPLFKVSDTEFFAKSWNGGIGWQKNYGKAGYERYSKGIDDYWTTVRTHLL